MSAIDDILRKAGEDYGRTAGCTVADAVNLAPPETRVDTTWGEISAKIADAAGARSERVITKLVTVTALLKAARRVLSDYDGEAAAQALITTAVEKIECLE